MPRQKKLAMIVVFNSSPIIFLSRLGIIDEALSLFKTSYIPEKAIEEIMFKKDISHEILSRLLESNKLFKVKSKNAKLFNALNEKLGKGESEAIAFAVENEALDLIILDDHVARREAMKLGLQVKGTLGLIKRLSELKEISISSTDDLHKRLLEMNFRIRSDIFNKVFSN
jgi:predicted nucleic acid-binding protein